MGKDIAGRFAQREARASDKAANKLLSPTNARRRAGQMGRRGSSSGNWAVTKQWSSPAGE